MNKDIIRDYELDIIVKAWRDENFRQKLLKNPQKAIEEEFAIEVPKGVKISVHEESETSVHLIVPSLPSNFMAEDLSDDELKDVIGGVMANSHLGYSINNHEKKKIKLLEEEIKRQKETIAKLKDDLGKIKR